MAIRPLGTGKKPAIYNDTARFWLERLSKAALVDCCIDLLRTSGESVDEQVSVADAANRLRPVLAMRGDKEPK